MATTQITKQQMEVDYLPKCTPEQTNWDTWWTATLKLQSMLNRSLISSSTMRTQYLLQPNTWGKKDEKWQFVHRFILLKTVPKYLKGINPYNRKMSAEKRWNTNILLIYGKFQLSPSPGDQGRMWEVKEDGKTFSGHLSVHSCQNVGWIHLELLVTDAQFLSTVAPSCAEDIIFQKSPTTSSSCHLSTLHFRDVPWSSGTRCFFFLKTSHIGLRLSQFFILFTLTSLSRLTNLSHHVSEKDLEAH